MMRVNPSVGLKLTASMKYARLRPNLDRVPSRLMLKASSSEK